MEKVLFALEVEDGWPPVGTEGVWCEKVGENYQLKNVPFFIAGIAAEDIFHAIPDQVNDHIFEFEIVEESGHSVIWLMNNIDLEITEFVDIVKALGCSYEGFPQYSLAAIDAPPEVDVDQLNEVIDKFEEKGIDFAFPVWRLD
ncbi:DUF4265 domain-containing protein [Microbulbifer sp. Q7]|uniref:DUF4265 domain-containing protein n=1 Tax=Microbulbifer sp. Q7 TaxID=1785091 RepID=UPI00083761D4|nr:DUF4265 domain-containing protein [Microbulbifer sp. Q7]